MGNVIYVKFGNERYFQECRDEVAHGLAFIDRNVGHLPEQDRLVAAFMDSLRAISDPPRLTGALPSLNECPPDLHERLRGEVVQLAQEHGDKLLRHAAGCMHQLLLSVSRIVAETSGSKR